MIRILTVEDDAAIANLINMTLTDARYECTVATDGEEGLELIENNTWDLVLLDLMLPKVSGYELLEIIRRDSETPVIIISAMNQVSDRIRGLRMGADDYLCKPFQIGELVARVESVLRRTIKQQEAFTYAGITVDSDSRRVFGPEGEILLTTKEFDLLDTLIRNKNIALTREYLYESVWKEEYLGQTRTLDNHIQRIRKKLGWDDVIQTVFRIGYRLFIPESRI
ncbi:DNA-binding response regulator, OmpR family, contains REC and winged-helix (wHTH) domain [Ruminococcaceae bacterium KH2T8]|nr:DNA-binding response regulator, OmpR family, contains REC and winged-helix (wHTH) domain [Ruminococcaceae bacterium KH2T8]